jgi:acetyltransferase-like isoleucine patch superfamily enzyme/2-polyprenyl-3-methyl-5-hydroxy-6-metoxy-1,4-benzoquinol methylase/glycosyltransferase involved in cell wall biosynthesis
MDAGIKEQSLEGLLLNIDNDNSDNPNAQEILLRFNENDQVLNDIIDVIDGGSIKNINKVCNTLAAVGFENESFEIIIPLLHKALEYDSRHKDSLMNLSITLAQFGETDLAIQYANQIEDKSEDVLQWLENLGATNNHESDQNILSREQNDVIEEHLQRYMLACSYVQGKDVLDAACGNGYGSNMLQQAGARVVIGVDISEESLISAKKTYGADNVDFGYGDVNELKFENESFDVVVSFETIEHIESGARWIKESARVLKEDGIFLVSTPNRTITNPGAYFVEQPLNPQHRYEYTVMEFIGELTKEYDVLEIYGQMFMNQNKGHELVSLGEVKDAQPMYVVAVCRKKRKEQALNKGESTIEPPIRNNAVPTGLTPFFKLGNNTYIADGAEIVGAEAISIGDNVFLKKNAWLNIALNNFQGEPRIVIDNGCQIGKSFTVSVSNKAVIEKYVIIGPNVHISDHGHAYENIALPIMYQGVTSTTNEVVIGEGSWIGINSVIVGNVRVGKGCVIAANSFVNKDIPDFTVAAGNPAKIIKMFDPTTVSWVKVKNDKDIQQMLKKRADHPLISICIPTFNRARDLERCLESIFSQIGNHSLFEVFISNNHSTDHTEEIILKYKQKYNNIIYWKNEENIGGDPNIALTMQKSKGKYMILHGDDDFFNPGILRTILHSILSFPQCGVFFLNVLNDNKEIKVLQGIDKFLEEVSIGASFMSSIILSREELDKLEEPFKFMATAFNQIYIQYSILENNPNFCLINDSSFTYAGNDPIEYNFAEVFIRNYIDMLEYFKKRGLSEAVIQADKKRILLTTILPWFKRINERKLTLDISNFEQIFGQYYHNEPYYEEAQKLILDIRTQYR